MIVDLRGIEAMGRHGVDDDERRAAQTFLFDVTAEIDEPKEDSIDATVDYRALRDAVKTVCESESYRLLETLAAAVADAIAASLPVRTVSVRVRKPGIAWAEWSAVTVERP